MNKKIILSVLLLVILCACLYFTKTIKTNEKVIKVDVNKLTYNKEDIKTYTQDDYEAFLTDYNSNKLPKIYITEFIFDGSGMLKAYDLDDYIENGNEYETKVLSIKAFNVNTIGNIEFTGSIKGGMILVNTNNIKGDINLILNDFTIDTDSKKTPAIFVYNKNTNYNTHKVTISPKKGTKNYIAGGKLKKVSLLAKEELNNYSSKYTKDSSTWYSEYTNYYGVYTKDEIDNVLFAKVTADSEDLQDGDPYYFYKAAGAISSDIDLYFEGEGFLSVTSKNKEGIETKGNLTFSGSVGNYEIYAEDDCLNTTTKEGRNNLTIDVESLKAIVSIDADEGDAIDSNGTLTINGGNIIAISHPGADAGLDSEKGTYINGGTVLATGDMYDQISSDSKQNFIVLSFNGEVNENETIVLNDGSNVIFEHKTDRKYSNLVYSSKTLINNTYYLYKDKAQYGYASKGLIGGMGQNINSQPPEIPNDREPNMRGERPELPSGEMRQPINGEELNGNQPPIEFNNMTTNNNEFTIDGISNLFSGVGEYKED